MSLTLSPTPAHNPCSGCSCPTCRAVFGDQSASQLQSAPVDAASLSAAPTTPTFINEYNYITGIDPTGHVLGTSFKTWNGDNPATYDAQNSFASKWSGSVGQGVVTNQTTSLAGSAGGTEYYYFDPASSFTPAEQTAFVEGLSIWSAEANIQFAQETTSAAKADLVFKRGTDGGAHEDSVAQFTETAGATALHNQGAGVSISIDTSVFGFANLGDFNYVGGYSVDTVVHEEGHFLGLGHGGPYNGNVDAATQQYSAYDTRLWTLMSYISPDISSAKYASQYTVTGTSWGSNVPTTPMLADIAAAQQLYGAPTMTPLSGGQVFGFNCNVAASIKPFFDFTVNTNPVITLYDAGTGNTLDLSGYTTAASIDLRPFTFSSFDGLVNNLSIAQSTRIDTFIGTSGHDTVHANADSDTITLFGTGNTVTLPGAMTDYTLTGVTGATQTFLRGSTSSTYKLTNAQTVSYDTPCYAAGTRILTERGERAVETLRAGDRLVSVLGQRLVPVVWIGHRHIDLTCPEAAVARPVIVQAGAFGDGIPHCDLRLSPEHAVFVGGVLVPIRCLVNDSTITFDMECKTIAYLHIELPAHDVVLAEGLPAESWLDTGNRPMFANAAITALRPSLEPGQVPASPCAPLVIDGPALVAIRERLAERAAELGAPAPAEIALMLADGVCRAVLPAGIGRLRLLSEARIDGPDRRRLGALLRAISLGGTALPLDAAGWSGLHGVEFHDGVAVRWTDGDALIRVAPGGADRTVEVAVAEIARAA